MTDTFQTKATQLQAKQFGGTIASAKALQEWLGDRGSVSLVTSMKAMHPPFAQVQSPSGIVAIEEGSYLLLQDGAPAQVMKAALFEAMFQTAGNA